MNYYVHPSIMLLKRMFDIVVSVLVLLFLFPIFPMIALLIKLNSPGPIFFQQLRIGRLWHEKTDLFMMIKFRTMRQNAEKNSGPVWATKQDNRITSVGKFLRKTRLDELPQLYNVLKGDMSLIGPRPERPGFYKQLETAIPFYTERTYGLAPGITGLAQVNLGYDETIEDVRNKLAYDHAYALALTHPFNWLSMDTMILFKTVGVMLGKRGQ